MDIDELQQEIDEAIAEGVNAAAEMVLHDIQEQVAVRSGQLRDSYNVSQPATAEEPTAVIESSISYRLEHYPYTPERFRRSDAPGLFDPDRPTAVEELTQQQIEIALIRRLS